jgi:putative Holliday junction resolvase
MGRVLGLDFGRKRIGAALSDPGRSIATPLEVYEQRDRVQNARHYRDLVDEHDVDLLVVGLPLHTSGRVSELAEAARSWGDWLSNTIARPVAYFDERYTSVEAERVLLDVGFKSRKRKNLRDMLAAQLILQAFLDAGCPLTTADPRPLGDSTPEA